MKALRAEDVRAQLRHLCSVRLRGKKLQRILTLLVEEWIADGGKNLTLNYIGESLNDEPLTYEEDFQRWSYPKTRANLGHVRNRLRTHYETDGYRDPIIIKLNPGSYVPVIEQNTVSTSVTDLDPAVARLVLRAKTALDSRTLRGAWRALHYHGLIPIDLANSRQTANCIFIPLAAAAMIPSSTVAIRPLVDVVLKHFKESGTAPWEGIFAEACGAACYRHQWKKALELFSLAIQLSQGEAKYFWWYTALLASQGRAQEAIEILDGAVRHFSRTNIAVRADLSLLHIMVGNYDDAEETLLGCFDFAAADNPVVACHLAMLYERQDRLEDALKVLTPLFNNQHEGLSSLPVGEALERRDLYIFLNGMLALVMGRAGATEPATQMRDILLECKAKRPAASSLEIALAHIGVGDFDGAIQSLNRAAFEESDPFAMWYYIFPPLRHLRGQAAFASLLKRLGLPRQRAR
jgi:tetratricopeptide (TPR) repeat protein